MAEQESSFSSLSQDKHCLLELGLLSVEGLLRHGIYPIVVHIRPKAKKHKKLRYVLLLNAIKLKMLSMLRFRDHFLPQ